MIDLALLRPAVTSLDGNGMIYAPFFNYSYGDLSMTFEATRHDHTRMGLSDAGAHCGAICDGGVPTFMLTHWTRDRARGRVHTPGGFMTDKRRGLGRGLGALIPTGPAMASGTTVVDQVAPVSAVPGYPLPTVVPGPLDPVTMARPETPVIDWAVTLNDQMQLKYLLNTTDLEPGFYTALVRVYTGYEVIQNVKPLKFRVIAR